MLDIRDKTFDYGNFVDVIDAMDSVYIAQKLCGKNPEYYVVNAGVDNGGYVHRIVIYNKETNTGFSLFLYENQVLKWKGYLRFQIKDVGFDARKNAVFLKKLGIQKWDKKKEGIRWAYAIYLHELSMQTILTLASNYSKYLL